MSFHRSLPCPLPRNTPACANPGRRVAKAPTILMKALKNSVLLYQYLGIARQRLRAKLFISSLPLSRSYLHLLPSFPTYCFLTSFVSSIVIPLCHSFSLSRQIFPRQCSSVPPFLYLFPFFLSYSFPIHLRCLYHYSSPYVPPTHRWVFPDTERIRYYLYVHVSILLLRKTRKLLIRSVLLLFWLVLTFLQVGPRFTRIACTPAKHIFKLT